MRILITCPNPPWQIGGVERVVGEIAKRLAVQNEVIIFTIGEKNKTVEWNDIKVKIFKNLGYSFSLKMMLELKKNIHDINIIHTHSLGTLIPLVTFLSVNNKIVVSPHYHTGGSKRIFTFLKKIYDPIFCKIILKKAKKIICVSETEKNNIMNIFNVKKDKIEVIPNGINIETIRNSVAFNMKDKSGILLYVGRLEQYKNIHLIIKSMSYMPSEYKLYILGNGPYKIKLQQLIDNLKLHDKVQILSGLSDTDIFRWYKTCDLVLNLSSQEAFGITVIEGLAAGKNIVVNNKTSLKELASKFEYIKAIDAECIDSKELAQEIIIQVKNGKTLKKLETDLSKYTWDSIMQQTGELYEKIINDENR
jgi:glycosyltransferase involved in cell wall biosynthesis